MERPHQPDAQPAAGSGKGFRISLGFALTVGSRWPSRWNQQTRNREDEIRKYLGED